jgi:hypothetical protein
MCQHCKTNKLRIHTFGKPRRRRDVKIKVKVKVKIQVLSVVTPCHWECSFERQRVWLLENLHFQQNYDTSKLAGKVVFVYTVKAYARVAVWLQPFLASALDIGKDITKIDLKQDETVWTGFIWLGVTISGGFL